MSLDTSGIKGAFYAYIVDRATQYIYLHYNWLWQTLAQKPSLTGYCFATTRIFEPSTLGTSDNEPVYRAAIA